MPAKNLRYHTGNTFPQKDSTSSPLRKLATWTQICASLNHRKIMKTERQSADWSKARSKPRGFNGYHSTWSNRYFGFLAFYLVPVYPPTSQLFEYDISSLKLCDTCSPPNCTIVDCRGIAENWWQLCVCTPIFYNGCSLRELSALGLLLSFRDFCLLCSALIAWRWFRVHLSTFQQQFSTRATPPNLIVH